MPGPGLKREDDAVIIYDNALSNYCHEMYMFKYWDLGTNQQIYHNQYPFIMEQAVLRPERFDSHLVMNTEN